MQVGRTRSASAVSSRSSSPRSCRRSRRKSSLAPAVACQITPARAHGDRLPAAQVAHADDALLHGRQGAVAAIQCQPRRPVHARDAVASGGTELALAFGPDEADFLFLLLIGAFERPCFADREVAAGKVDVDL